MLHLERSTFGAMGTTCAIAATAGPEDVLPARRAIDAAQREVAACERALSRFDERSDLSRLNRAAGAWTVVHRRLIEALTAAVRAREATDGLFDPTVLPALVAAGYDRSFELLTDRPSRLVDWQAGAHIDIDARTSSARIEPGAAVDLGGIGKGFAAARALNAMRMTWQSLPGALIDLGGDVTVWGAPPDRGLWLIDIADPRAANGGIAGTLRLTSGSVATSGRDVRRFGPDGRLHHLIDPATGTSAVGGPLSVTVVAPGATAAETHATALAVTGVDEADRYVRARSGLAALLVPERGRPIAVGDVPLVRARPRLRLTYTTHAGGSPWH